MLQTKLSKRSLECRRPTIENLLQGNIKKFYYFRIIGSLFYGVPVLVLFWQDNGLSLTEVMLLQSIYSILTVLLEIPTGFFADLKGRRPALMVSGGALALGVFVFSIGYNFWHFLVAEVFFALSISLSSGTLSAFLFDTLKALKREKEYPKIWGDSLFYSMLALSFSNIVGGLLGEIDLRWPFYATTPFFLLLVPLAYSLTEPPRSKIDKSKSYLLTIKEAWRYSFFINLDLRAILLVAGIVYAFNQSALWLYPPYFKISGLDVAKIGFVFASFQVFAGLSSKWTYLFQEKLGRKNSFLSLLFLVALSYFLMHQYIFVFSFLFCYIQQFIRGFKKVAVSDFINQKVPSETRATILSFESFVSMLIYALVIPVIGWISDIYSLKDALLVLATTSFVIGLAAIFFLRKISLRD